MYFFSGLFWLQKLLGNLLEKDFSLNYEHFSTKSIDKLL